MERKLEHLLSKHKVLVSFSIAKHIDDARLKELTEKIRSVSKNKVDFNKKLRSEIENETTLSILSGTIPGLIVNGNLSTKVSPPKSQTQKKLVYNVDKKKLAELYTLASAFNKEVLNNKLSKDDVCFIIYTILNFLDITENDFKKFHEGLSKPQDTDTNNEEDDSNE